MESLKKCPQQTDIPVIPDPNQTKWKGMGLWMEGRWNVIPETMGKPSLLIAKVHCYHSCSPHFLQIYISSVG